MELSDALIKSSSLTKRQLDSLTAYTRVVFGGVNLKEAASLSSHSRVKGNPSSPVTIGSYYRTVNQARVNIKESLTTVLIAGWLGLVKIEDIRRLLEVAAVGSKDLSYDEVLHTVQVIQALLDRMVL